MLPAMLTELIMAFWCLAPYLLVAAMFFFVSSFMLKYKVKYDSNHGSIANFHLILTVFFITLRTKEGNHK